MNRKRKYLFLKRIIDFSGSLIGLVILSPALIFITIFMAVKYRGNPFFRQDRSGRDGCVFKLVKFKTMNDKVNHNGSLLPDIMRLTAAGKFLRKFSLDELPQLVNVLAGDMSLVGPRPLPVKYAYLYDSFQARRLEVRPGITGLAQTNGRNLLSWEQKFSYDVHYVDNLSFWLDIKIIFKTFFVIFKSRQVFASSNQTMLPFEGSKS